MNKFGLTESDIYILENLIEKVLDNENQLWYTCIRNEVE